MLLKILLRAWRINVPAVTDQQLATTEPLVPVPGTVHFSKIDRDPTILGWIDPLVGGTEHPAYLCTYWRFDDKVHAIEPVPGHIPSTLAELDASVGVRGISLMHSWSKTALGHEGPRDVEGFRRGIDAANHAGIAAIVYAPNSFPDNDPSFGDYIAEISSTSLDSEPSPWWNEAGVRHYAGPLLGAYRKFRLWECEELLKAGVTGFYLDGSAFPVPAKNLLQQPYVQLDPDTLDPLETYPIFETRKTKPHIGKRLTAPMGDLYP